MNFKPQQQVSQISISRAESVGVIGRATAGGDARTVEAKSSVRNMSSLPFFRYKNRTQRVMDALVQKKTRLLYTKLIKGPDLVHMSSFQTWADGGKVYAALSRVYSQQPVEVSDEDYYLAMAYVHDLHRDCMAEDVVLCTFADERVITADEDPVLFVELVAERFGAQRAQRGWLHDGAYNPQQLEDELQHKLAQPGGRGNPWHWINPTPAPKVASKAQIAKAGAKAMRTMPYSTTRTPDEGELSSTQHHLRGGGIACRRKGRTPSRNRVEPEQAPLADADDESWYTPWPKVDIHAPKIARKQRSRLVSAQGGVVTAAVAGLAAWKAVDIIGAGVRAARGVVAGARKFKGVISRVGALPELVKNLVGPVCTGAFALAAFQRIGKLTSHGEFAGVAKSVVCVATIGVIALGIKHGGLGSLLRMLQMVLGFGVISRGGVLDVAPRGDDTEAQSGKIEFSSDSLAEIFTHVAAASIAGEKVGNIKKLVSFVKGEAQLGDAMKKNSSKFQWLCDKFVVVLNKVLSWFGGPQFVVSDLVSDRVRTWSVVALKDLALAKKSTNPTTVGIMRHHADVGGSLRTATKEVPDTALLKDVLAQITGFLLTPGAANIAYAGARPQPPCVMIRSKPGVGKTTFAHICAMGWHKLLAPNVDQSRAFFVPTAGSRFKEGYANQTTWLVDDFLQEKEAPAAQPSQIGELISLVNANPYPLDMAYEDGKGKTFMTSKVVMLTTNIDRITPIAGSHIRDMDALTRRISHCYQLVLREDLCVPGTPKADPERIRRYMESIGTTNKLAELENYTLVPVTIDDNPTDGEHISGLDFFKEILGIIRAQDELPVYAPDSYDMDEANVALARARARVPVSDAEAQGGVPVMDIEMGGNLPPAMSVAELMDNTGATCDEILFLSRVDLMTGKAPCVNALCAIKNHIMDTSTFRVLASAYTTAREQNAFVQIGIIVSVVFAVLKVVPFLIGLVSAALAKIASFFVPHVGDSQAGVIAQKAPEIAIEDKIFQNLVTLHVPSDEEGRVVHMGDLLFLHGNVIIGPAHTIKTLQALGGTLTARHSERVTSIDLKHEAAEFYYHENKTIDLACVVLSGRRGAYKDLTGHFARDDKEHRILVNTGEYDFLRLDGDKPMLTHVSQHAKLDVSVDALTKTTWARGEQDKMVRVTRKVYSYPMRTDNGYCGGVLYSSHKSAHGIIGIHVAGHQASRTAYGVAITQKLLAEVVPAKHLSPKAVVVPVAGLASAGESKLNELGFTVMAQGPGVMTATSTGKKLTQLAVITPGTSPAPWVGGMRLKPAWLRPFVNKAGEQLCPMTNCMRKIAGQPEKLIPLPELVVALRTAMEPFMQASRGLPRGLLTWEEAIFGDGVDLEAIPSDKSTGYLLRASGVSKRTDLVDFQQRVISKEFMARLLTLDDMLRSGQDVVFPYTDFLKDEVRDPEKVQQGKSRLISASCLEYVILWRRYYGRFTSAVIKTRIDSGMALGINPLLEADRVVTRFSELSDGGFLAGDFSGFDVSQQAQITSHILKFQRAWLNVGVEQSEAVNRVRRTLANNLVNSVHVNGFNGKEAVALKDTLYFWNMSMPSGHPATTVVNCMYNLFAFVYAYNKIVADNKFHENVRMMVYGDDNVVKVSQAISEVFTQPAIASELNEGLGLVYTNEEKEGTTDRLRGLHEISFLKRKFVENHFGGHVMQLNLDSINKALCWTGNSDTLDQTILNQLYELAFHDITVWGDYVNHLKMFGVCPDGVSGDYSGQVTYRSLARKKNFDYT